MNNELYFIIIVIEVIILLILLYKYNNKKHIKEHHPDHSESANPGMKFYDRNCSIYPVVQGEKTPAKCMFTNSTGVTTATETNVTGDGCKKYGTFVPQVNNADGSKKDSAKCTYTSHAVQKGNTAGDASTGIGSINAAQTACQEAIFTPADTFSLDLGQKCDLAANCTPANYRTIAGKVPGTTSTHLGTGKFFTATPEDDAKKPGYEESQTINLMNLAAQKVGKEDAKGPTNVESETAGKDGRKKFKGGPVRASLDRNDMVIARDCIPAAAPGVVIHEHFTSRVANFGRNILESFGSIYENFKTNPQSTQFEALADSDMTQFVSRFDTTCAEENTQQKFRGGDSELCSNTKYTYAVQKLVEVNANSGFWTLTIRLHGENNWKMAHTTKRPSSSNQQQADITSAASYAGFLSYYDDPYFFREFKHVIEYDKIASNTRYDFAKAIVGTDTGYNKFKWTIGGKNRSTRPYIDITTCPIPWNASCDQIVLAIAKVWSKFEFHHTAASGFAITKEMVSAMTNENYNGPRFQIFTLNDQPTKPLLSIHVEDVNKVDETHNIYNYKPSGNTYVDGLIKKYSTESIDIKTKLAYTAAVPHWNNGADSAAPCWNIDNIQDNYPGGAAKAQREGGDMGAKERAKVINCIPYRDSSTAEGMIDARRFVPRRLRIGFIDTGNFTPNATNFNVITQSVPLSLGDAINRSVVLDSSKNLKTKTDDSNSIDPSNNNYNRIFIPENKLKIGDFGTDPGDSAVATYFTTNADTLFEKFEHSSNANNLTKLRNVMNYPATQQIGNYTTRLITPIQLGNYKNPNSGNGRIDIVQKGKPGWENCHSGFGASSDNYQFDHTNKYSCSASQSYIPDKNTSNWDNSEWNSHGLFLLGDEDYHMRNTGNFNIIKNPKNTAVLFCVFFRETNIKENYSLSNTEALKLHKYWTKLQYGTTAGNQEKARKITYLNNLFNKEATLDIKVNLLYQTLVMINNYLSTSFRLTRGSRQENGHVANTLRAISNFAKTNKNDLIIKGATTTTPDDMYETLFSDAQYKFIPPTVTSPATTPTGDNLAFNENILAKACEVSGDTQHQTPTDANNAEMPWGITYKATRDNRALPKAWLDEYRFRTKPTVASANPQTTPTNPQTTPTTAPTPTNPQTADLSTPFAVVAAWGSSPGLLTLTKADMQGVQTGNPVNLYTYEF